MKIKSIHISNYRKVCDAYINMEDNLTVIAGANNSGKTSLVELFNAVFGSNKDRFCDDDLPAIECQKWSKRAYPKFCEAFSANKSKEETTARICEFFSSSEKTRDTLVIPPLEVKIQVDYNKSKDDIRNFADYIMELDPSNTSFYFTYRYAINIVSFAKSIDAAYDRLSGRFQKLTGDNDKDKETSRIIKDMLVQLYAGACDETTYFSDKSYTNIVDMDVSAFKALFNYHNIMAGRTLDDEGSDRTRILSKNMIDLARKEDGWKDLIRSLPDKIIQPIQDARIQEKVRAASLDTLSDTMDAISKTNGGQAGNIVIDMDVTEDAINSLLKNITCAKYQVDEYFLREASQGLGYSNLIYIHLELEKFKKTIDPLIVNFFVIEEPEAHMHPQMQKVFSEYVFDCYNKENVIQGMLTTHSHEVIRTASISQLRVLRQIDIFKSEIFDLHEFQARIESNQDLLAFYNWFYTINFPDMIFADKIIMYEGDTERMLIKSVLQEKEFEPLRTQYISFVQVGGAYAYKYKPIIDFLGIKSVLITDLDYNKDEFDSKSILSSCSTNSTINKFAEIGLNKSTPTVQDLYDWHADSSPIVIGDIYLAFQGKADSFSRTLEEAMLSKHYRLTAIENKPISEWKACRDADKLKYVIPQKGSECNIRQIVSHTANAKTDFMYSVILNKLVADMLPNYIKEALLWLIK